LIKISNLINLKVEKPFSIKGLRQAAAAKRQRLTKTVMRSRSSLRQSRFMGNKEKSVNGMDIAPLITIEINRQFFGIYES
jgi:hypothetical protein